jgi:catechol 2,3-dioxygenase-like lactoylglutathione lyase family enzyme
MSVLPSLHHIAVGTRDVAALSAFYCSWLEIRELRRHLDAQGELRSIWLNLSGTILMIERAEPRATRPPVSGVGLGPFLLAFRANSAERRALVARAAALGVEVEAEGEYTSYLRDPDGNRIAVSEYEVPS